MIAAKGKFQALAVFLVTVAVLVPFAFAQSSGAIGSSIVAARLEYSILVPPAATDVIFSTYAFGNFSAQSATFNSSGAYSVSTDSFGNTVLSFHYKPVPNEPNRIAIDALVNVSYDPSRCDFEPVAGSGADYLSQSKLVIVDSQAESLAASIASNATGAGEAVAALSSWVYENIVYDSKYKDEALDSTATLAAGRGTCDEKAHLLEALLRSRKIPARHVVGFAYSGEDWQPHAWVEAAVDGKWVPIDPTFNEIFFIDASHLRLAVGRDQEDTKYSLKATGTSDLSGTTISAANSFSFISQPGYSQFFLLSASFPGEVHGASQTAIVNATVQNLLSRTIAVPVSLLLHPDFSTPSEKEQVLVIPAGSQATASWDVVYPFKVVGGYSYNYSSTVSAYGSEQTGYLLASQDDSARASASVAVENFAAKQLSDGVQLYFWLHNTGNAPVSDAVVSLSVPGSNFSQAISYLAVGDTTRVEFLVPYPLVAGTGPLETNLSVKIGEITYAREVTVDLSERPTAAPTSDPLGQELSSVLSSPQFALAALAVVLASLMLAFGYRKKRR
ncbi:MAG: transglutaminase-like domain-containing protein [Candidatus Micrarchaeia archaeon]